MKNYLKKNKMENMKKIKGFYNPQETSKREKWIRKFNEAMNYANSQMSKAGLVGNNIHRDCENYANDTISWKEFKDLYKII